MKMAPLFVTVESEREFFRVLSKAETLCSGKRNDEKFT